MKTINLRKSLHVHFVCLEYEDHYYIKLISCILALNPYLPEEWLIAEICRTVGEPSNYCHLFNRTSEQFMTPVPPSPDLV